MSRGIIYVMSSAVRGIIKIGITSNAQYPERMRNLEANGYHNVSGLKREFAIEVDDYEEKEALLKSVFDKIRVGDSELYSLNKDLAIQLLSAFDGKVIYPESSKEEIFLEATENVAEEVEYESSKNKNPFKDIEFSSSLTQRKYFTKTNDEGRLGVFDAETGVEIRNYSRPSKRQIAIQAVKDLGATDLPEKATLYQAIGKLEKLLAEKTK